MPFRSRTSRSDPSGLCRAEAFGNSFASGLPPWSFSQFPLSFPAEARWVPRSSGEVRSGPGRTHDDRPGVLSTDSGPPPSGAAPGHQRSEHKTGRHRSLLGAMGGSGSSPALLQRRGNRALTLAAHPFPFFLCHARQNSIRMPDPTRQCTGSGDGMPASQGQGHRRCVQRIRVRGGEGDKDRVTLLPAVVKEPFRRHLDQVKAQYEANLHEGYDGGLTTQCTGTKISERP